jgi:hypothetical protein
MSRTNRVRDEADPDNPDPGRTKPEARQQNTGTEQRRQYEDNAAQRPGSYDSTETAGRATGNDRQDRAGSKVTAAQAAAT